MTDERILAWVRILKVADDGRAYKPDITPMDVEACVRGAVAEAERTRQGVPFKFCPECGLAEPRKHTCIRGSECSSAAPEAARIDAALRACDGLATVDLAGNKRGWLAELCYDAHKLDEPHKAGAEKCLKIVQDMRSALVDEDGVDYGILSRVEYRLQKVVDTPVAPLPSIPSPLAEKSDG